MNLSSICSARVGCSNFLFLPSHQCNRPLGQIRMTAQSGPHGASNPPISVEGKVVHHAQPEGLGKTDLAHQQASVRAETRLPAGDLRAQASKMKLETDGP